MWYLVTDTRQEDIYACTPDLPSAMRAYARNEKVSTGHFAVWTCDMDISADKIFDLFNEAPSKLKLAQLDITNKSAFDSRSKEI